jgi:hypothetical protein
MRTLGLVALAATTACATLNGDSFAPPPSPFRGIHSLVLVRAVEGRGQRPKDPLDGLDESLRARGFTTRVVELGPKGPPELAPLQRLFDQLGARASSVTTQWGARPPTARSAEAGEAVAKLGVDAVATYHHIVQPPVLAASPSPFAGTLPPAPSPVSRPLGALALVDRAGHVETFVWGSGGNLEDPGVPLNAAEAIDLLVRALTGDAAEE